MSKTLVILLILSRTSVVTFTAGQPPADPPQTCKAEEEWKVKNGKEGCYCIDRYSVNDLSKMLPDLACGAFDMNATFHKCQFKDLNIYFDEDNVEENICYDFKNDSAANTFTISAPIHAGSCAFKSQETSDSQVTYTSHVLIGVKEPGAIIIRKNKLNVTLKCSYDLDMITSLHKILNPILSPVVQEVPGKGIFKIYMSIFKKSDYTEAYSGSGVTLNTDEFLYVGVFVYGGDASTLLLVVKNCYATPENDVNYAKRYEIIQNSCPSKTDGTIKVDENGKSREGKFAVKMFKFADSDKVYLHCKVSLCDSSTGSCAPNCGARGSRIDGTAKSYDASKTMTIGPIIRSGEPKPDPSPSKSGSSTITNAHIFWTLLIPALIILIQSL